MGNYWSYSTAETYKKYGWRPDRPDHRDHKIYFTENLKHSTIDLRPQCPRVYNQGQLGSCSAQAIAFAYEFDEMKQKEEHVFTPSKLFIYYNERDREGTTTVDSGSSLRDGIKTISKKGVCEEKDWPYDITKFTEKPYFELYEKAKKHKCIKYKRVDQREKQIKMALHMGFPVVFGISVYESFESIETYKTGIIKYPDKNEKNMGGHAIAIVGYNDDEKMFIIRNSWGSDWGDEGYGYIPYDYVLDGSLAGDFWIVERVLDKE